MLHNIKGGLRTERLVIGDLTLQDSRFMHELTTSAGWLRFIGDRGIATDEDAQRYIQKILDNPGAYYWVVRLPEDNMPIGVITLIKRNYLPHNDIGFAFLPQHGKQGFAFEAANAVLEKLKAEGQTELYAITITDNTNSIKLLEKLGLVFDKEIEQAGETLSLYSLKSH